MKNILFVISFIILTFTSCVKDTTNTTDSEQESENSLIALIPTISDDFEWNMFQSVNIDIATSEKFSDSYYYKILIYDKNPLYDNNASLLSSGVVKKDMKFTTSIDVPSALHTLYVKEVSPQNKSVVVPFDISENNTISYTFTNNLDEENNSASSNYGLMAKNKTSNSYTFSIGDAQTINSEDDFSGWSYNTYKNTPIYVPEGVTIHASAIKYDVAKIKLDGTLIIDKNLTISTGSYIEVFSKGNVLINDNKNLKIGSSSQSYLAVANGGILSSENPEQSGELTMNTNTNLYNEGHINVYDLTANQTDIHNDGSIIVNNTLETHGNEVFNNDYAYIQANDWKLESTNVSLGFKSVIYIKNELTNSGNLHYYKYVSDKNNAWSYIVAKTLVLGYGIHLDLYGNINIATDSIANYYNNSYNKITNYTIQKEVIKFSKFDEISLPTSDFIPDLNGDDEEEDVTNPEFPVVTDYSNLFTFISEDTFPAYGDYDMNDIVIDFNKLTTYTDSNNKVSKFTLDLTLRAYGGSFKDGFAIQLNNDITASNIKSVSVSNQNITLLKMKNNIIDNNTEKVAIPLFDDCSKVFGDILVNVLENGVKKDPINYSITVEFNNPVDPELLSTDNINPFIFNISWSKKFVEIHTPNSMMYETDELMPKGKFMWALKIPLTDQNKFRFPLEYINIKAAYPDFVNWVEDEDNLEYQEWYNSPNEDNVKSLN